MADSSKGSVSYWQMGVHLVLVNRLGCLLRNNVAAHLNMTIVAGM